jgi:heme/copper-type cytochrome/quinol oxidase subunit 4
VLLGLGNIEALAVIAVAIVCINVLQLFVGLSKLLGVSERQATWAIPVIIIACLWLTKIIFVAIYPVLDQLKGMMPRFGG